MRNEVGKTDYKAHWISDCRTRLYIKKEHQLPYKRVDIEVDKVGETYILARNNRTWIIEIIEFPDRSFLFKPSYTQLAQTLSLKTA